MNSNLIAELVKKGISARNVAKVIAKTVGVSEKTARNKINGTTEWTLPEAIKINDELFERSMSIEYLFERTQTPA